MRAIHWVRSRQESEELSFWLSIVAYNPKDRSLSNQMYLFYLLVFFSIWWFIVLVWFANTGGMLLSLLFPMAEMNGAIGIELVVLLIWFLTILFMALLKSPVAFSEEDAYIVCQMPLSPRKLVLRWSFLPWVKSLIPFLIVAMALGFSLADVTLKAEGIADPSIFAYILDGLRAALVFIPIHLAGFALTWANGVWFMTHQRRKAGWIFPILTLIGVGAPLTLGILASFDVALPGVLGTVGSLMPAVLLAGFGAGGAWQDTIDRQPDCPYRCDSDDPFGCPVQREPGCSGNPNPGHQPGIETVRLQLAGAQPSCPAAPGDVPAGEMAAEMDGRGRIDLERYSGNPAGDQYLLFLQSDDLHRGWTRFGVYPEPGRTDHHDPDLGDASREISDKPAAGGHGALDHHPPAAIRFDLVDPGGPELLFGCDPIDEPFGYGGRGTAERFFSFGRDVEPAWDDPEHCRGFSDHDLQAFSY